MRDKELTKYLQQSLQREIAPETKREETVRLCTEIMRKQGFAQSMQEEPRQFIQRRALRNIFRSLCRCLHWLSCRLSSDASIME